MKRFTIILLTADADTDHGVALQRATALAKNNQATLNNLTQIDCSVLSIKPPGFVSPVTMAA